MPLVWHPLFGVVAAKTSAILPLTGVDADLHVMNAHITVCETRTWHLLSSRMPRHMHCARRVTVLGRRVSLTLSEAVGLMRGCRQDEPLSRTGKHSCAPFRRCRPRLASPRGKWTGAARRVLTQCLWPGDGPVGSTHRAVVFEQGDPPALRHARDKLPPVRACRRTAASSRQRKQAPPVAKAAHRKPAFLRSDADETAGGDAYGDGGATSDWMSLSRKT